MKLRLTQRHCKLRGLLLLGRELPLRATHALKALSKGSSQSRGLSAPVARWDGSPAESPAARKTRWNASTRAIYAYFLAISTFKIL